VLALLGLNVVVLAAWTAPRTWRQRNAAARVEASGVELQRQRAATTALRLRAAAIQSNTKDLERFYGSLAGNERTDLVPTLEAIEELARRPGLRPVSRVVRRVEVPHTPLERVAVALPLEGSYGQLVGFLREVERSPRFLTVDRVSMRAEQAGAAALQVELSTYLRQSPGGRREGRRGRS
jgi:Tfp pilus assembly protein PilO